MKSEAEDAIVQSYLAYQPIAAAVSGRVSWDDDEIDLPYPSVTLRELTSIPASPHLKGRGGVTRTLMETTVRAQTFTEASQLANHILDALEPFEEGPVTVALSAGGEVTFGSIRLDSVQQAPTIERRSHRKLITHIVSYYD